MDRPGLASAMRLAGRRPGRPRIGEVRVVHRVPFADPDSFRFRHRSREEPIRAGLCPRESPCGPPPSIFRSDTLTSLLLR